MLKVSYQYQPYSTVQRLDLNNFRDLFCQFCGNFAESSRKVRGKFAESPRASRNCEELKKCETDGFAFGGANLVIPNRS